MNPQLYLSRHTIELKAVDIIVLGFTILLSSLVVVFGTSLPDWRSILLSNLLAVVIYLGVLWWLTRVQSTTLKAVLRIGLCLVSVSFLFKTMGKLVNIFFSDWFDASIAELERMLFGVYPTVWLQKITTPLLTEWLMFSYVIYGPMMPFVGFLAFTKGGLKGMEEFITGLVLANVICFIIFPLVPVDWPGRLLGHLHTVPLKGYFFTSIADLLRTDVHFPGGCLPSPHCAVSTVMLVAAYRHNRGIFFILLPIVLSIYVSTVYGRFHYASDVPAGILTAFLAVWAAPKLQRAWDSVNLSLEIRHYSGTALVPEHSSQDERRSIAIKEK